MNARRIAIAGGGITGLAAAHRILEVARRRSLPVEVALFEASHRLGGVISSFRRDGFLLEEGPDSIITDKPWARELAERLGIGERLVGTQDRYRRSFVVRRGRMRPTPDGFYLLAPSMLVPLAASTIFSPLGKARMALDLIIPRRTSPADESIGSFVTRRLGREALERMAQPMVAGIYGADPHALSLQATFPRFRQMETEHGSVIRAMWAARRRPSAGAAPAPGSARSSGARYGLFVSFDAGLQVLTDTLAGVLPEGLARTGTPVSSIAQVPPARWSLTVGDRVEEFDAVILALRAHQAATLVRRVDEKLADRLASIPYTSAVTVSLAFPEAAIAHPLDGFGFVVPTIEKLSMLGCTFCHRKYASRSPDRHALVRAFCGESVYRDSDEEIIARVLGDLRRLLGIRGEPSLTHLARWPRSMPQYMVGHLDLVSEIENRVATHHGLALAGNAYRGIGVPDCVHSGEKAAEAIIARMFS